MIVAIGIIFFLYILLLLFILLNFKKNKTFTIGKNTREFNGFSILIPFKDEEKNLPDLIKSLNQLDYPKHNFEVIFVNDHSIDEGEKIITEKSKFPFTIIPNSSLIPSKKSALENGVNHAVFDYIITTDADCMVPSSFLEAYNGFINLYHPKMILGPVQYISENNFLDQFQNIEFMSLQGFTIGSLEAGFPFLANGANLCFEKKTFVEVEGYKGNEHIASGDDVFLLEKFRKEYPDAIKFLKAREAIVLTKAQNTWKSLYQQKIRWASKSTRINNRAGQITGIIILLTSLSSLILFAFLWIQPLFALALLSIKCISEALFIKEINKLYQSPIYAKYFIISFLAYPFYTLWILRGIQRKKYFWKGNKYNT